MGGVEVVVHQSVVRHANRAGLNRHACQLAWALSVFLHRSGRWHDRAAAHRAALGAARRLADTAAQARAHRHLAAAEADLGRFPVAHRHYGRALDLAEAMGDLAGQAEAHYARNLTYGLQERPADALAAAQQARHLFEIAGDRIGHANALTDVGWWHARLGDQRQAVTLLQQALALHRELDNLAYQAHTWSCHGETHSSLGDHTQAIPLDAGATNSTSNPELLRRVLRSDWFRTSDRHVHPAVLRAVVQSPPRSSPVDAVDRLADTEIMAAAAKHGSLPPPASASAVADAEQKIGHRLPVLLRRLYTEAKAALPQGSGRWWARAGWTMGLRICNCQRLIRALERWIAALGRVHIVPDVAWSKVIQLPYRRTL
ncbi:tetratricopeptide repeat protein [Actinomadura sp. NPDC000600]|uniref:tetratricopeptide repeat protein n=1 Tax=Actinomadura sp. NPDC000600 TaxID=3154262 RepID=UPI0033944D84